MQLNHGCDIRLNESGQADVDYYLARARAMRAAAISAWFQALKTMAHDLVCRSLAGCSGRAVPH